MLKIKNHQNGNTTTITIGVLAFLVIVVGSFSFWAFTNYTKQRDTVNQQVSAAVQEARKQQRTDDEKRFEEERKSPYRSYTAPEVFGGITLEFPKNWNVYVIDKTGSGTQVDLTIHPDKVRESGDSTNIYAFRMELKDSLFERENESLKRDTERGNLKAKSVTVSDIEGVQYDGEIERDINGRKIILPYRDKTIIMWTESRDYFNDFQEIMRRAQISR